MNYLEHIYIYYPVIVNIDNLSGNYVVKSEPCLTENYKYKRYVLSQIKISNVEVLNNLYIYIDKPPFNTILIPLLLYLYKYSHNHIIKDLILKFDNIDISLKNSYKSDLILEMSQRGDIDMLRFIFENYKKYKYKIDINYADIYGNTPLINLLTTYCQIYIYSPEYSPEYLKFIRYLLSLNIFENNIDYNKLTNGGHNPLTIACHYLNEDLIDLLFELEDLDINYVRKRLTPFSIISESCSFVDENRKQKNIIVKMIRRGFNIHQETDNYNIALKTHTEIIFKMFSKCLTYVSYIDSFRILSNIITIHNKILPPEIVYYIIKIVKELSVYYKYK